MLIRRIEAGEADSDSMKEFYKSIGDKLKHDFSGWKAFLLCHQESPHKFIGLRPSLKRTILNGSIPVKVLGFEMYDGSKKDR